MTTLLVSLVISLSSLIFGGDEVEIVFAGDAMQHEAQNKAAKQADGTYSFDECFASIAPYVQAADYAIVNLETPLGGAPYSGYPMFCAPDSYSMALKNAGFDLMLTANNHALDKRDKGAKRTLDVLDEQGLAHVGTYRNKADREKSLPLIKDINGFKIGFLNYTYGTNGIKVQNDVVERIRQKEEEAEERIRFASAEDNDRLKLVVSENELRIRDAAEKTSEAMKARIRKAEENAAETEKAALGSAQKEAEAIRKQAEARLGEAVALVVQAVLQNA